MGELQDYLTRNNLSPTEFGRMLGLKSRASVPRYLKGERKPADSVIKKIKDITNGAVTADSFHE